MTLNYKYTILYTFVSLLLLWIVIKYGSNTMSNTISNTMTNTMSNTMSNKYIVEGLTMSYPKDAVINYNDTNSPEYSHTVNLPINDPVSCKNFCGPNAKCLLTGEQCSSDIDCQGCNPGPKPKDSCITKEVDPYDNGGKLGQQGLQYSPLTTGYDNHNTDFAQIYPGSKDAEIKNSYQGLDKWTKSFNEGLNLYNKRRESADKYSQGISNAIPFESDTTSFEPKYPTTVSATGQFFETTPPAANASLQK